MWVDTFALYQQTPGGWSIPLWVRQCQHLDQLHHSRKAETVGGGEGHFSHTAMLWCAALALLPGGSMLWIIASRVIAKWSREVRKVTCQSFLFSLVH